MTKHSIAVLGAGHIGGTLGRKWVNAGHQVLFGVNDPQGANATALRAELGEEVHIGTLQEALLQQPEVVLLAIPGRMVDGFVAQHSNLLDGRIIIDAANRMGESTMHSFTTFAQEAPHAQLYRAFNTYGYENFADPTFGENTADLFFCGTDGETRAVVEQLISDVGLRPIYLGGVDKVEAVDGIAAIWFALAFGQGRGRNLALKLLER